MTRILAIQMTLPPGQSAGRGMVSVHIDAHKFFDSKSGDRHGD